MNPFEHISYTRVAEKVADLMIKVENSARRGDKLYAPRNLYMDLVKELSAEIKYAVNQMDRGLVQRFTERYFWNEKVERNLPLLESGIANSIVREDDTDLYNFVNKSVRLFEDQEVSDDIHRELQQVDVQSSLKWRHLLAFWENEERERMDELEDEFESGRMASRGGRSTRRASLSVGMDTRSMPTDELVKMIQSGEGVGADLRGENLRSVNLAYANLRGANLAGSDLRDADLQGAYIQGADLEGANLKGANLQGADLQYANFAGANLLLAILKGAKITNADLQGANLQRTDLSGAYLRGADLQDADLEDTNLKGANLKGALLKVAYLAGANLTNADLQGANLKDADLQGANLKGANLQGANLTGVKYDSNTVWPEGFTPPPSR